MSQCILLEVASSGCMKITQYSSCLERKITFKYTYIWLFIAYHMYTIMGRAYLSTRAKSA